MQFKYGNLYTHAYSLGDPIVWGSNQVGDPSEHRVMVEGLGGCPRCNSEFIFDILIEDGILKNVTPSSGAYDYIHGEGNYLILGASSND